jgi:hypothetical protein
MTQFTHNGCKTNLSRRKKMLKRKMPEPGTDAYERMIDFMRADLESGMAYSKIEMEARKIIEARGGNFDEEFEKWKQERESKFRDALEGRR